MSEQINAPRRKFALRNALFILPNAFTLSSIFCGLYAIIHATSYVGPDAFYQSATAILLAGFFDMLDGRVARLTRTQSEFGVQLDSLADVVSFGVAPAIVVYKWALWPLGWLGLCAAFFYAACGAVRLARFNVIAMRSKEGGASKYFVGLPIPLAAATLVMAIMAHFRLFDGLPVTRYMLVLVFVVLLGLLMVSTISYWTFKEFHLSAKTVPFVFIAVLAVGTLSLIYPASACMLLLLIGYIVVGLTRFVMCLIMR